MRRPLLAALLLLLAVPAWAQSLRTIRVIEESDSPCDLFSGVTEVCPCRLSDADGKTILEIRTSGERMYCDNKTDPANPVWALLPGGVGSLPDGAIDDAQFKQGPFDFGAATPSGTIGRRPADQAFQVKDIDSYGRPVFSIMHGITPADPTGTLDSTAAYVAAKAAADAGAGVVGIPKGTFRFNSELKVGNAGILGAGSGETVLVYKGTGTGKRFLQAESNIGGTHDYYLGDQLGDPPPALQYCGLNDQAGGLATVTCTTAAQASRFAIGDWVSIAAGANPYDADTDLWRVHVIAQVTSVDAGTGVVGIDTAIDQDLDSDEFGPGERFYTVANYAASHAYTAGDAVYEQNVDPKGIYVTDSNCTSSAADVHADNAAPGCTWRGAWGDLGAYRTGRRDKRPVMQKMVAATHDVVVKGFRVRNDSATDALVSPLQVKGVVGGIFEDIVIEKGVNGAGVILVAEGSRDLTFRNIHKRDWRMEGTFTTAVDFWNTRNLNFEYCSFLGGAVNNSTGVIFAENFGQASFDHCKFSKVIPNASVQSVLFSLDSADIRVTNSDIYDWDVVARSSSDPLSGHDGKGINGNPLNPAKFYLGYVSAFSGNTLHMDARTFRPGTVFGRSGLGVWVGNTYVIDQGCASGQTCPTRFSADVKGTLEYSFPLSASHSFSEHVMPSEWNGRNDMIALGGEFQIRGAPSGCSVTVGGRRFQNGVSNLRLFAVAGGGSANSVVLTSTGTTTTQVGTVYEGLGDSSRLIQASANEEIGYDWVSNSSCTAGTLSVRFHVLVDTNTNHGYAETVKQITHDGDLPSCRTFGNNSSLCTTGTRWNLFGTERQLWLGDNTDNPVTYGADTLTNEGTWIYDPSTSTWTWNKAQQIDSTIMPLNLNRTGSTSGGIVFKLSGTETSNLRIMSSPYKRACFTTAGGAANTFCSDMEAESVGVGGTGFAAAVCMSIGSTTISGGACLCATGDDIWHDTNCNNIKETGENFIDLLVADGDKGDITVSSTGTVWTIDNDVVTFPKMQNIATDRLVGRDTAATGDPEELTVGAGLEFTGSGGIQRSALTGDVTAAAGSGTTAIAAGVILDADVNASAAIAASKLDPALIISTEIDTSSEIAGICTDETGTGALVFASTPTLVTPIATTKLTVNRVGGSALTEYSGSGTPYLDYRTATAVDATCVSAGNPVACCTGSGTGTCSGTAKATNSGGTTNYFGIDPTLTTSGDPAMASDGFLVVRGGAAWEGPTADNFELFEVVTDPTADRTQTHPNRSGTYVLSGDTLTGDVTGTLSSSGATALAYAGTVPVTKGGTGLTAIAAHQMPVGTAANTYTAKTIPDCPDTGGNHLNFTQSGDSFTCGTSGGSAFYQTVEDEGTPRTQRTNINFTGAGVSAVDSGGKTVVTIAGVTAAFRRCVVITGPDDLDNRMFGLIDPVAAPTITDLKCWTPSGSGSTAIITVQKRDSAGATPTGVDGANTLTCDQDGQADSVLSAGTMAAGDTWSVDVGATAGSPEWVTVCIWGTL